MNKYRNIIYLYKVWQQVRLYSMSKNFFFSVLQMVLLNMLIFNTSVSYAKEEIITSIGEYAMGQQDTLNDAQDGALSDALRSAVEQIGVYVRAKTQMDDFQVTKDSVEVLSAHSLKIIKKQFEKIVTPSGDIHIKAYITVKYDLNQVIIDLKELKRSSEKTGTQNTSTITFAISAANLESGSDTDISNISVSSTALTLTSLSISLKV